MKWIVFTIMIGLLGCQEGESAAPVSVATNAPQVTQAPTAQAAPKRIVFIGDSITARWPTAAFFRKTVNSGIGGQTSCEMKDRFYEDVLIYSPTVVVIQAGLNDLSYLASPSTDCIFEMVKQAQHIGARVIVGTLLPYDDWPSTRWIKDVDQGIQALNRFNEELKRGASTYGYTVADYYPLFLKNGRPDLSYYIDTCHPTMDAYEIMAMVLQPLL